jgi:hypothetical protein
LGKEKGAALTDFGAVPDSEQAASDRADTAFEAEKSGFFDGSRFTAR